MGTSTQNYPFSAGQGYKAVVAKTANYLIASSDNGVLLTFNGTTLTATLPAVAPPAPWFVTIINLNASALTISPNGLTLNGSGSSITLAQNSSATIWADGSNYEYAAGATPPVSSVFGRTGAVTAQTGDYTQSQISAGAIANGSTATTQTPGDNSTKVATDAYVDAAQALDEKLANKDTASGYAGLDANVRLKLAEQATAVDARTTTSEAITDSDRAKVVTFNNASAVAATIAQAGASSLFVAGWYTDVLNIGLGPVTITPATSVFNGTFTSIVLNTGQSLRIVSDGTNYLLLGLLTPVSPAASQVLAFNSTTNQWEPTTLSAIGNANAQQIRNIPVTGNAPADNTAPIVRVFPITSVSITSNVATLTSANTLASGDQVWVTGLGNATFLNNQLLTVLASGLSTSQFKVNFTHANYGPTAETQGVAETIYWQNPIPPASTVAVVTASLAAGAVENDTLTIAKGFTVFKLVVSAAARVRLYSTAAARTADALRSNQTPPTPGTQHGVIADWYLDGTTAALTWLCAPSATGFNGDGPQTTSIYAAITNIGLVSAAITVTLYYVPQES